VTATIRRAPRPLARLLRASELARDIFTSNIEYVLVRP
jgi:hypothetical protein